MENIKKLINNAGLLDKGLNTIIENAVQSCDTRVRFKRSPPRPVVGLSKPYGFHETVSLDLHEISFGLCQILMIDEFTRYSNAVIIKKKS